MTRPNDCGHDVISLGDMKTCDIICLRRRFRIIQPHRRMTHKSLVQAEHPPSTYRGTSVSSDRDYNWVLSSLVDSRQRAPATQCLGDITSHEHTLNLLIIAALPSPRPSWCMCFALLSTAPRAPRSPRHPRGLSFPPFEQEVFHQPTNRCDIEGAERHKARYGEHRGKEC